MYKFLAARTARRIRRLCWYWLQWSVWFLRASRLLWRSESRRPMRREPCQQDARFEFRNNVRGKDEQGSSRCREFPLQVMPPIVADTFLIGASASARSVELYSVLTCKAKKQVSPYLFAERKASGTGARVKPFRELRWRDVVLRRNARDYYAAGRTGRRMRQPSTAPPSAKPPSALSRRTLTCHTRM